MKNYIFDLYGTLIDIHTDEQSLSFWKKLCVYLNERGYSYKEIAEELGTTPKNVDNILQKIKRKLRK